MAKYGDSLYNFFFRFQCALNLHFATLHVALREHE